MSRVRVIHVIEKLAVGGAEVGVASMLENMTDPRFEHVVCTVQDAPYGGLGVTVPVIRLGVPQGRNILVSRFLKLFLRERPGIVHTRNWGAIEAVLGAKLARVPVVIHCEHGRDIHNINGLSFRRRAMRRVCYAAADFVFAVSEELRSFYASQVGIPESRMGVVRNGIDVRRFAPDARVRAAKRADLGLDDGVVAVGCVARFDPIKDHQTLLMGIESAIEQGAPIKLFLVGGGPQEALLREFVKARPRLREHVVFTGLVADVQDWLNAFDLFVLSSLSEAMSNTIVEAMLVGVPPVVTAVGGNPELIQDGCTGVMFPAGDAGALAAHCLCLARDPEKRARIGAAARAYALHNFSMEAMVARYEQMYSDLWRHATKKRTIFWPVRGMQ